MAVLRAGTTVGGIQDATLADIQSSVAAFAVAGGAGNAYTAAYTPTITSLTAGMTLRFQVPHVNTGPATLNIDGIGAVSIRKQGNALELDANDLLSGSVITVTYDGAYFQLDASNNINESNDRIIAQAAHSFLIGTPLRWDSVTSKYVKAKADGSANAEVIGLVSQLISTDIFIMTTGGYVEGLSGLVAGSCYFLSDITEGTLSLTEPSATGHISKPLLVAISATEGYFFNYRGAEISGDDGDTHVSTVQGIIDAVALAGSKRIVVGPGTYAIDDDLIIPSDKELSVVIGAILQIADTKTLTINGPFEAGLYQVFDCVGTGAVLLPGTVTVITQWFGESGKYKSIGTAVYVDEVVINKAIIAAGDYGTIEFLGDYYIGAGLTMGVTQKWYGRHSPRVGGPTGFAFLYFSINSGAGITTNGNSVLENLRISTLGGTSIGVLSDSNGINATNLNISGSNIAMSLKQNWYSTIRDCHFSYLTTFGLGIKIDYCYDLIIDRVIINAAQTMILSNATNVHVSNSCFEGQGSIGLDVGIGCQISITDTYFESGYDGSMLIQIRNSSRISVVNSHVYMTNCYRFLNASGSTNVSIFSRNNYFRYPAIGDTTTRFVYVAPSSGSVDIEGDNWEATDPAVVYFGGASLPKLNYRVIFPNNHPTPHTYLQEGGARGLRAVTTNGIVGTFICANNKYTVVNNTLVTTASLIFLSPNNAAAAALQAGASVIFPINRVDGTSFTAATADGNPAAGTENFVYFIIN
jgi:hypothetical protein